MVIFVEVIVLEYVTKNSRLISKLTLFHRKRNMPINLLLSKQKHKTTYSI